MSRGQTWGEDEVLSLIGIFWGEKIQSMVDNTSRNKDVYKIVEDLMKRRGHLRNAAEIRTKVNNLKQWYKKVSKPGKGDRYQRSRIFRSLKERLSEAEMAEELRSSSPVLQVKSEHSDGGNISDDGSGDVQSSYDTNTSTASPPGVQDTEDINQSDDQAAGPLPQGTDSRKRKRTTPDRVVLDPVDDVHKDDNVSSSPVIEQTEGPECYPKGVFVVQPTAVEDDTPTLPQRETASSTANESVQSNQRVLFSINPNLKKAPVPILPKITAVHSGIIPTREARANHNHHQRHSGSPYERSQNRQRHTRVPQPPRPPPSGGFDSLGLLESQQQEEHEAKMELYRLQIELATAQLRMAEDEHRIRFAKLQVELQTAQMEHDAKASQLSE